MTIFHSVLHLRIFRPDGATQMPILLQLLLFSCCFGITIANRHHACKKAHRSTLNQSINQRWCKKMGQTVMEKSGRDFTMRHHETFKLQRDL